MTADGELFLKGIHGVPEAKANFSCIESLMETSASDERGSFEPLLADVRLLYRTLETITGPDQLPSLPFENHATV